MKSINCSECPWKVKNRHNSTITGFSKRTGKAHNCHMTQGVKDFWNPTQEYICRNFRTKKENSLKKQHEVLID